MVSVIAVLLSFVIADLAGATTYYIDLVAGNCSGTYSISNRDCSGSDGTSYGSTSVSSTAAVAGDTVYIRARDTGSGVYTTVLDMGSKRGTAGNYLTVSGFPGETVMFRIPGSLAYMPRTSGMSYVIFQYLTFDGTDQTMDAGGMTWNFGEHHVTWQYNELMNMKSSFYVSGDGWLIKGNYHHNTYSDCVPGHFFYGIYLGSGDGSIVEDNTFEGNAGGGAQFYPGPITNLIIRRNIFRDNNYCSGQSIGGLLIGNNNHGATIVDNLFINNGSLPGAGSLSAIELHGGVDNTKIINNTIYGNRVSGIRIEAGASGTIIKNNLIVGNGGLEVDDAGTGTVYTTNRTTGSITDCTISTSDFRLKVGTNPCRNAGTADSLRPSPVDGVDIGAYEQGKIISAVALGGGGLELTASVMTPGVLPTSAITGISVACVGCTGTPAVGTVSIKAGSDNIIMVPLSGLTGSGSCTVTLATTNATDSGYIGAENSGALAQGVDTVNALAVSGVCANSGGGSPPGGALAYYNFNASDANDQTANNNDGVVDSGITFQNGFSGLDAKIPIADGGNAYYKIEYPAGASTASTNPTTQSWSWCGVVTPDLTYDQKVVFSSGGNGNNQRFYLGWVTAGGQKQWGIGIQGSGFSTGSEFPVVGQPTLVCLVSNSGSDTATLWVNRTKGVQAGKSVKTFTSFSTTGTNFRIGSDGTFSINTGGFTIDEPRLWSTALSDADVQALYDALFPGTAGLPCYSQSHVQYEAVNLLGGAPLVLSTSSSYSVDANGAVAIRLQIDCLGSAGGHLSITPYYSSDGTNFSLAIPSAISVGGLAMWGAESSTSLNDGVTTGCIDSTGLTPNDGVTILTDTTSPTFSLAQNHCITYRIIIRIGDIANQTRYIRFKQDNGQDLLGGYGATATIHVVNPRISAF